MQSLCATHDTVCSTLLSPLPFGLGSTDQLSPSHASISVWSTPPVTYHPTAMHAVADTHETERSSFDSAALESGLATNDQFGPRATRGACDRVATARGVAATGVAIDAAAAKTMNAAAPRTLRDPRG